MKVFIRTAVALLALLCCSVQNLEGRQKIKSLCEVRYPSDARIEWSCLKLKSTDTPDALFVEYWQDVLRFNSMDRRHFYGGISIKVPMRLAEIKGFTPLPATYPEAAFHKIDYGPRVLIIGDPPM